MPGIALTLDTEYLGANLLVGGGGEILFHALGSFKAPEFRCDFGNRLKCSNEQYVISSPVEWAVGKAITWQSQVYESRQTC